MFHKGRSHIFFLNPFIKVISEVLALQSNLMLISPEVTEMSLAVENSAPATPVAKKGRLVPSGFYNI